MLGSEPLPWSCRLAEFARRAVGEARSALPTPRAVGSGALGRSLRPPPPHPLLRRERAKLHYCGPLGSGAERRSRPEVQTALSAMA